MSLFDASEYGPERPPRAAGKHAADEVVAIHVDAHWKGVNPKQHGVVHALTGKRHNQGGMVSYCGKLVIPKTFEPGETVLGCQACIDRGAPVTRARPLWLVEDAS